MISRKQILTKAIEHGFHKTVSGYPTVLTECNRSEIYKYRINGNTYSGKNLFDMSNMISYIPYGNGVSGSLAADGARYQVLRYNVKDVNRLLGKWVTLSADMAVSGNNVACIIPYWCSGSTAKGTMGNLMLPKRSISFKLPDAIPENCDNLQLFFYINLAATDVKKGDTATFTNIQMELGKEATAYEPHEYKFVGNMSPNLIPYPYTESSKTVEGITYKVNDDGSIHVSGTNTGDNYVTFLAFSSSDSLIPSIKVGDTITFSVSKTLPEGVHINVNGRSTTGSQIQGITLTSQSSTLSSSYTVPEDWVGMLIQIYVKSGATVDAIIQPQLELGSTATEFMPYGTGNISINNKYTVKLTEPLRIANSYADTLEYPEQRICRRIKTFKYTTSDNWVYETTATSGICRVSYSIPGSLKSGTSVNIRSYCNLFSYRIMPRIAGTYHIEANSTGSIFYCYLDATQFADIASFDAYAKANNLQFGYVLDVPEYQNTSLPVLHTDDKVTSIEVDTEVNPSSIEVTYNSKLK